MAKGKCGRKRGFVLITMSIAAVAVIGGLGMAVDVGRMFIVKNETQTFCDAAALAAATKLDGTSTGITNAKAAVTNTTNAWNMGTSTVSSPTVEFASSLSGTYTTSPSPAKGYTYVRVKASVNLPLYFVPLITGFAGTARYLQNVQTQAVAAQIPQTTFSRGLAPYTAVTTHPTADNYGFSVGAQYDIQWPEYNGNRAGCSVDNPDKCFNADTCSGEPKESKAAVTQYWGANYNGYWGGNSNSDIYQEVLNQIQLQPITVGQNIYPVLTAGNKAAEAKALDTRVQQDEDYVDTTNLTNYLANSARNGRRLIALPVVDPETTSSTPVIGYASFLLISDGTVNTGYYQSGNGNDPFCAIYVGPYVQGGTTGGAGGVGAYKILLVQ